MAELVGAEQRFTRGNGAVGRVQGEVGKAAAREGAGTRTTALSSSCQRLIWSASESTAANPDFIEREGHLRCPVSSGTSSEALNCGVGAAPGVVGGFGRGDGSAGEQGDEER
jgi:hypothetical protein